jgi:error-prone DNA polymerase
VRLAFCAEHPGRNNWLKLRRNSACPPWRCVIAMVFTEHHDFLARPKEQGIRAIVGAELTMEDSAILPVFVENRAGYQNLCRLLTRAHLRSEKGKASVRWDELPEFAEGLIALTGAEDGPLIRTLGSGRARCPHRAARDLQRSLHHSRATRRGEDTAPYLEGRHHLNQSRNISRSAHPSEIIDYLIAHLRSRPPLVEIQRHHIRGEERWNNALIQLAEQFHLPLLATNGVLYATDVQRPILDVFTCIRHHTHLDAAGKLLERNSERHLKSAEQMHELFRDLPEAVDNTCVSRTGFNSRWRTSATNFPSSRFRRAHDGFVLARAGFCRRASSLWRSPAKVRAQLENELALIQKLKVSGYFLIVWDIVQFCAEQNIMAQGRGSAANSTVCFLSRHHEVDPLRFNTLFERFLSEGERIPGRTSTSICRAATGASA